MVCGNPVYNYVFKTKNRYLINKRGKKWIVEVF